MNFENIDPHQLQSFIFTGETIFIYFLFGDGDELLYVGQTVDLYTRSKTHLTENGGIPAKKFKSLKFFSIPKKEANNAEAYCIVKFRPKYNKNIPYNDTYISLNSFLTASRIFKITSASVYEFIRENHIENINGYYRISDLKEIFSIQDPLKLPPELADDEDEGGKAA